MEKPRVMFTPLQDFESKRFRSTYHKGLSYSVKPTYSDEQYMALLDAVREWEKDGLVAVGERAKAVLSAAGHGEARVQGVGTVK